MGFSDLIRANYKPIEKEIIIKIGIESEQRELKFKAIEISYGQRTMVLASRLHGEDWASELIVASIIDEERKHMTFEQARALENKHFDQFFNNACLVNFPKEEDSEKN